MKKQMLMAAVAVVVLSACNKTETAGATPNREMATENTVTENFANESVPGSTAKVDAAFITDAMQGDNAEVAIGRLAQEQGASQSVKDFGKMLVTDHSAHKDKLKAMGQAAGVSVTDEPSAEGKANLAKLKALRGDAFDKQFKAMMVEDHTKDIAKYEKQTASGDAETAALARETLPILHKHLDTANAL